MGEGTSVADRPLAGLPYGRDELGERGMSVAVHAAEAPDRPAIASPAGDRTFFELNANANRLVRALRRRGVGPGSSVALVCSNRPEFAETMAAALRGGYRITPINWHLTGEEIAYIVDDAEAAALIGDARFADALTDAAGRCDGLRAPLAVGGEIAGFEAYEAALGAESPDDIPDPEPGRQMYYTSGTTGRPKGVYRPLGALPALFATAIRKPPYEDLDRERILLTGPVYHAAPFVALAVPLLCGVGVVMMDGFDAEECLRRIERHRITRTHMVPTMFHRLLALPEGVRDRYDVSSLVQVRHGAAPCPVEVKRRMIEWFGPVIEEYYAASEGGGGTLITSEEWLRKPGSVGKPGPGVAIEIRDPDGEPLPPGEVGQVWIRPTDRDPRFEYHKDPDKTARTWRDDLFTLGDMGHLDDDGYLFLTGRTAELIISGGVNIYPAEVDAVLHEHPSVSDACTVGVPNPEWGEEVKAVVELVDGCMPSGELEGDLIEHCRERLAGYKCPRSVDFTDELPRYETGKLYRRLVRDRYRDAADAAR